MDGEMMILLAGAVFSILVLLLFLTGYRIAARKGGRAAGAFRTEGIGLGLLPALAAGKAFEQYTRESAGRTLIEPLPDLPYVTVSGRFQPCRVEMIFLLIAFWGMCIWLMFRRHEWNGRTGLAGISLVLWAGIRTATECLREGSALVWQNLSLIQLAASGLTLICAAVWSARLRDRHKKSSQFWIDWLVIMAATAAIWLTLEHILTTGSDIGDLALIAGCGFARMAAVLELGGEGRRISPDYESA